jgi:hypothetical protein
MAVANALAFYDYYDNYGHNFFIVQCPGTGATTFSIMIFSITTLSITTLSIMTLNITTFSITIKTRQLA